MTAFVIDTTQIRSRGRLAPQVGAPQGVGRAEGKSGEMQRNDRGVLLSASDLMRFAGCAHATTLDLAWMMGRGAAPGEDSEDAQLLQRHGDAHEARHLAGLKRAGRGVVEIVREGVPLTQGAAATRAALERGAEVVFQGALAGGAWGGWSDFLERVERPSALGPFSYEVADTKLKRKPHPKHVLQLALYSDLLARVQGVAPEHAHVELGDGTRATIRLADVSAYARRVRSRLEAFVAAPAPTRPVPCADCPLCRWREQCAARLAEEDSLFRVANVTRGQVAKLEAAGVTTMAALAARREPVRGMAPETLARLVTQAGLQAGRGAGGPTHALRPAAPGKGFDLLPAPDPGDIFYDIEGDPHVEGGLEYLHGLWAPDTGFRAIWAHDRDAERAALAAVLDAFRARIEAHPGARIYHYASYEVTALRRLTAQHGLGEAFLDRLLRERRFVDLYAVVRGGVITSEPDYSIKSLEVFTGVERAGEVKTAGGSVVAYERWLQQGDDAILAEIEDYNRIDCVSTERLRDWLVAIRPAGPWPVLASDRAVDEAVEDAEAAALRALLTGSGLDADRQRLLFDLGCFHRREAKPAWWAIFDSLGRDEDELIDDLDCLGGLEAAGPTRVEGRSILRDYRYPEQETRLKTGSTPTTPLAEPYLSVTLDRLDREERTATVKLGTSKGVALPDRLSLHPPAPLDTRVLAAGVRAAIADQCGQPRHRVLDDLLARRAPRLDGGPGPDILCSNDPVAGTVRAVLAMQDTVLPIQGPPGTGKTCTAARAILALVAAGRRVAVSSTSHEAISNLLRGCLAALPDDATGLTLGHVELAHKIGVGGDPYDDDCPIERVTGNDAAALRDADVVGGTAFLFGRPELEGAFDTLVVDEAGQVGLANLLAMGRCARNIVLVGDPRQLPQVVQGAHPGDAGLSCLDWLLGEHATVPPDRGILLPVTRRMHPELCRFVSDQVYEGRLSSHPDTARQRVSGTGWPEAGAHLVEVAHAGNSQVARAEIDAIRAAIAELTRGTWTDRDGVTRPLREEDVIVVAPYNAQVNALRAALPERVRVGTVDKFQGQEAPVCLVSMTASSIEDVPRGMGFLFSLNRINVAVSRAKALVLVFASPRLLDARCATVEEVRLVNTLCALSVAGVSAAIGDAA